MGRQKAWEDLSQSQRRRYERYLINHPEGTLAEARGHAKKPPTDDHFMPQTRFQLERKIDNLDFRNKAGLLPKHEAQEIQKDLKEMKDLVKAQYTEKGVGGPEYRARDKRLSELYQKYEKKELTNKDGSTTPLWGKDSEGYSDIKYHMRAKTSRKSA